MIVLALDTAVTGCSACIADNDTIWSTQLETERGQAEFLIPMIEELIKKAGIGYSAIDRIAVTTGPGSFTGVRIGLSAAKSIALSLNKPLVGISTFMAIAQSAELEDDTLLLIDTKRGDYYGQVFAKDAREITEPALWSVDQVSAWHKAKIIDAVPDASKIANLAKDIEITGDNYDPQNAPAPLYLRGAEVSQSKRVAPTILKD